MRRRRRSRGRICSTATHPRRSARAHRPGQVQGGSAAYRRAGRRLRQQRPADRRRREPSRPAICSTTGTSCSARADKRSTSSRPHEASRSSSRPSCSSTGCALTLTSCAGADQRGRRAHRMSVWVSGTSLGRGHRHPHRRQRPGIPRTCPMGRAPCMRRAARSSTMPRWRTSNLPSPDPDVTDLADQGLRARRHRGEPVLQRGRHQQEAPGQVRSATPSRRRRSTNRPCSASGRSTGSAGDDDDVRQLRELGRRRDLRMTADSGTDAAADDAADDAADAATDADDLDRHRRRVLWALPTGLYLIGSRHGDDVNLMTANLVVQVCMEPKLVGGRARARLGDGPPGGRRRRLHRVPPRPHRRDVVRRFVKPVEEVERAPDGAGPRLVAADRSPRSDRIAARCWRRPPGTWTAA